jgi:serine/threonine-protein kinase
VTDHSLPGPGTHVGTYRLDGLIGEGGMGKVYRAVDTKFNRSVAIKFIAGDFDNAGARERFEREAQAVSSLNHPHILTVHDVGSFEGRPYLVSELIEGGTLRHWAASGRSWRQVVELMVGAADGLAAAHSAGIMHRDVKPENVLVTGHGYAKLTDFGLAKPLAAADQVATRSRAAGDTRVGTLVGTLAYMSPEQIAGKPIDARSDIFSFGVVLYELLSGRQPFAGKTELEILQRIQHQEVEPLPADIPPTLRMVVEKALEKNPGERYQTMQEMVLDLRRLVRQTGEVPPPPAKVSYSLYAVAAAIAAAGVAAWLYSRTPAADTGGAERIRSIAVLPFQNLSRDPEQEFFSDGTTETLIASLAQISSLDVISRTSVMRFKGTTRPMPEIGRELGADAIVEGSVQRVGGRVRITAQLVRAASDTHLWAREFDREVTDLLSMQSEVARAIAQEIQVQLTPQDATRLSRTPAVAPDALEAFLLGNHQRWKGNVAAFQKAIPYFERAIALQPDYAEAHARLSGTLTELFTAGAPVPAGLARSEALKAVELDPASAPAYAALGSAEFDQWNWEAADRAQRRALDLNPNDVEACGCYGLNLAAWGRLPEGLELTGRAVRVNPLSAFAHFNHGVALRTARRPADSIREFRRALELEPEYTLARRLLVLTLLSVGELEEAAAIAERPPLRGSPLQALVFATMGRGVQALAIVDPLKNAAPGPNATGIAQTYFALGDRDRGFQQLTKAFDARVGPIRWAMVDPSYDAVRQDPRFQALVSRLNFPSSVTTPRR